MLNGTQSNNDNFAISDEDYETYRAQLEKLPVAKLVQLARTEGKAANNGMRKAEIINVLLLDDNV